MSELASLVKAHDYDRYIATLFAPQDKREALFSLYAFDAEVSRIAELVHDPMPGEIRLQWWRDVINGARDGEAAGHPVADSQSRFGRDRVVAVRGSGSAFTRGQNSCRMRRMRTPR